MTKQRREGEANRPTRAKTGQRKLIKPSWTEFVRLADQAVVALAGADMINRAERRACGCSRRSRRLDMKWPETDEPQVRRQTKPGQVSEGRRMTRLASSRTGENPPYGMNRGGGGNFGMTRGLFATMPERAETLEALGLKPAAPPPHSTPGRPAEPRRALADGHGASHRCATSQRPSGNIEQNALFKGLTPFTRASPLSRMRPNRLRTTTPNTALLPGAPLSPVDTGPNHVGSDPISDRRHSHPPPPLADALGLGQNRKENGNIRP